MFPGLWRHPGQVSEAVSGLRWTRRSSWRPSLPFPDPLPVRSLFLLQELIFSLSPPTLGSGEQKFAQTIQPGACNPLQLWNPSHGQLWVAPHVQSRGSGTMLVKMGMAAQSPLTRLPSAPGPSEHPSSISIFTCICPRMRG